MMSKKIIFKEKKKLKNITGGGEKRDTMVSQRNQIPMINQLYLHQDFDGKVEIWRAIKKKIASYRMQDVRKKRYIKAEFITYEEVIEKLVLSKLKCKYCYRDLQVLYNYVREDGQWTLDRINNDIQHTCRNTNISCLRCNIQKGRMDDGKFTFTKQMRITKGFKYMYSYNVKKGNV